MCIDAPRSRRQRGSGRSHPGRRPRAPRCHCRSPPRSGVRGRTGAGSSGSRAGSPLISTSSGSPPLDGDPDEVDRSGGHPLAGQRHGLFIGVVAVVHEEDLAAVDDRVPAEGLVRSRVRYGEDHPSSADSTPANGSHTKRSAVSIPCAWTTKPSADRRATEARPGRPGRHGPRASAGRAARESTAPVPADRSLVTTVPSARTTNELYARSTGSSREATTARSGSSRCAHRP